MKKDTMKEEISEKEPLTEETVTENAASEETAETPDRKDKKLKADNKKLKAENESLKKELDTQRQTAEEIQDKYARVCAEYENFRRRTQKEKEDTYAAATADAIESLLPLLDNLMLASSYGSGDKVIEGVQMILNSVPDVLQKMNVTAFGMVGDAFDPNLHNAVLQVQDDTKEEGTIAAVLQVGYKYKEKIIRHAMVSVVGA